MVFGANNHRYQLQPKLTAQQINNVETEYCCRSPSSYRSFLTSLGNCGAIRTWLVITGPMKDTIWQDFRCNIEGVKPVIVESNRYIDFLKWYEYWLDESLKQMIQ